ncbi:MAG: tRNA (N(6)-L-threonylcarbamoyladenosine(37)-C(2))-methylthiotransferase MtaB [Lachnospiraceae bacterium]|nr:tRNA (N(6)-L-threonylcarbamoyladenosine(37)-C(2))-methylthiotransferase MtaB [Lachnospiraceae bacterium]
MQKGYVAFLTLGCKVNTYETNAMQVLFRNAGYTIVDFDEKADIYIVNTCSVTNMADRKSRQMLHKAKKKNPNAIVVAVGCYVQVAKDLVEQDEAIDVVIGNNKKHEIVEEVEQYIKNHKINTFIVDVFDAPSYEEMRIEDAGKRTRAFIKIQDGCNQFCSYCIIPFARGHVRSREKEDILQEIKELVKKGYKEFVLNGIHLSSYGADQQNKDFVAMEGKPLLDVLEAVSEIEGVERIRLGSLEPRVITDAFVARLCKIKQICPHFHLSLQSGCDATLKRMNRRYTTEEFAKGCEILRQYYSNPAITTDVIVGFPGETEEEFSTTKKFVETIGFAQMHIFKFSVRKGTRAEGMKPQIDEAVKTARSAELLLTEERLEQQYQQWFIGRTEQVLFEELVEIENQTYLLGHNERYIKIAIPYAEGIEEKINKLLPVKIEKKLNRQILLGKIG